VWGYRGVSLVGVFGFVGLAWLMSENRSRVSWRPVLWGVALQLLFGAIVLGAGGADYIYGAVNTAVGVLLGFSDRGAAFVFASFIPHQTVTMGPEGTMVQTTYGLARTDLENWPPATRNVAFAVLPTIIFFSALMSLAYHVGIMTPIVKGIAWVMVRTLGTSGAESLSAAANIFVGQTEAPLLVKPFVANMTRSELNAVMVGGFATVAGGVMGVYVMLLQDKLPSIAGHLVVASILSAPAALAIAKVIVPETEKSVTAGSISIDVPKAANNAIEAAANGATDGMKLLLNVVAMLIAIVALVAMANWAISFVPVVFCPDGGVLLGWSGTCSPGIMAEPLSLSRMFGWVFLPASILMGCPIEDWTVVGKLLGEKIVLTELLAYKSLSAAIAGPEPVMTERSAIIASYALCGFANFASIGIQLGGIGGLAPQRMADLATLGFKAMMGGAIAACMTGAVAGVFL
jgi:CNT family concentrative nucleoside transporter